MLRIALEMSTGGVSSMLQMMQMNHLQLPRGSHHLVPVEITAPLKHLGQHNGCTC